MKKFFRKVLACLALKAKCREADARHRTDGRRYFVIPVHGTLQTVNIEEMLTLKKQGAVPADLSNKLIYYFAYYWSDTKAPKPASPGPMPRYEQRRRMEHFYKWFLSRG